MKNLPNSLIRPQNSIEYPLNLFKPTLVLSCVIFLGSVAPVFAEAEQPRIVDNIPIQHHAGGKSYGYTLPVYQVGDIRFLSGGVGIEEREATYPPFPVKLILAQQPRAFLTHVSILIQDEKKQTLLDIPQELVTGPWVFIDLPPGQYHIVGKNRNGIRIERTIRVKTGTNKVLHLIWPAPSQ